MEEVQLKKESLPVHPRENGGILSYLTFAWVRNNKTNTQKIYFQ